MAPWIFGKRLSGEDVGEFGGRALLGEASAHPVKSSIVGAMHDASQRLLGLADFAAFCQKREGATTIRTLLDYSWTRTADGTVCASVIADAFCRSMVRALVGVVIPVGDGRRPVEWPAQVLVAGQRHPAVVVMPAHGLSLEEVFYPPEAELGSRHKESRVKRFLGE